MENYEKLIAEIDEVVKRIKGLYDLAYTQYSHAVDEVILGRLTDEKQIEHILDGIIDFGDALEKTIKFLEKQIEEMEEELTSLAEIEYKKQMDLLPSVFQSRFAT